MKEVPCATNRKPRALGACWHVQVHRAIGMLCNECVCGCEAHALRRPLAAIACVKKVLQQSPESGHSSPGSPLRQGHWVLVRLGAAQVFAILRPKLRQGGLAGLLVQLVEVITVCEVLCPHEPAPMVHGCEGCQSDHTPHAILHNPREHHLFALPSCRSSQPAWSASPLCR